jgi:hypothetical protein
MNEQQLAAVKLALEALLINCGGNTEGIGKEAITALQSIIEQPAPVQEPVAVVSGYYGGQCVILPINPARLFNAGTAIYTTPPAAQKPWVDLPDEEIDALAELHGLDYMSYAPFVRALEQRLKEKNHG